MTQVAISGHESQAETFQTSFDIFKYLKSLAQQFGFKKFSVVEVPWKDAPLSEVSILNNWDPEFVQAYDEYNLARNSPIFKHSRSSMLPLLFDVEEVQREDPTQQRLAAMQAFDSFKTTKGLVLPVAASSGLRGAVTFTGTTLEIEKTDIRFLHLEALYLFDRLIVLRGQDGGGKDLLSEREIECLTWSAMGKTSGEIALITEITENSVNNTLTAICKKLDATNRPHAVAKALRLNLIQ